MTDPNHIGLPQLLDAVRSARNRGCQADMRAPLNAALQRYHSSAQSLERIAVLKSLAQIERDLGQLDRAQAYLEQAIVLCRIDADRGQLAHTVRHLGDVLQARGRASEALASLSEAVAIYRCELASDPGDVANALRSLALQYEHLGQAMAAQALWKEARAYYLRAHVTTGAEECARHLLPS